MRRQIDEMTLLLKKHNITAPAGTRKGDQREEIEDIEDCFKIGHALKAGCSTAHVFVIDSGASNHMVASRESFSSLKYFDGPSIQLGNNSKVKTKREGIYQA